MEKTKEQIILEAKAEAFDLLHQREIYNQNVNERLAQLQKIINDPNVINDK